MMKQALLTAAAASIALCAPALAQDGALPAYDGCSWSETRLAAPGGSAIRLNIQICEETDQQAEYEFTADGELVERYGEFASVRAQLFREPGMAPAALIAEIAAEAAGPEEAARCTLQAYPEDNVWVFEPDEAYQRELDGREEPYDACGPYGVSNQVMFFQQVGRDAVAFVWAGQDLAMFDPWSIRLEE